VVADVVAAWTGVGRPLPRAVAAATLLTVLVASYLQPSIGYAQRGADYIGLTMPAWRSSRALAFLGATATQTDVLYSELAHAVALRLGRTARYVTTPAELAAVATKAARPGYVVVFKGALADDDPYYPLGLDALAARDVDERHGNLKLVFEAEDGDVYRLEPAGSR
jgi:hypothetical protein